MNIICTCCGGSGKYNPLFGPAEPCATCKGEGSIGQANDEVPTMIMESTPADKSDALRRLNGKMRAFKQMPGSDLSEAYQPRIHRKGGDISIKFTTKTVDQDAFDTVLRSFYRQLSDLGCKVEGFQAKVGGDRIVLSGEGESIRTTWLHEQTFSPESLNLPLFNKDDPALALFRKMQVKQAGLI